MGSFSGKLFDWADKPLRERTALYRDQQTTVFCPDNRASTLDRVLWLKDENLKEPFQHVLDIGCHDGFVTRWLRLEDTLLSLQGIDPCKMAIDIAKENNEDPRFHYDEAAFEETTYTPGKYDALVCFEVLEHFTPFEVDELLTWMRTHAATGARMYFCTPNRDGPWGLGNDDPCHVQLYTMDVLCSQLRENFPDGTVLPHQEYPESPHLMVKVTL